MLIPAKFGEIYCSFYQMLVLKSIINTTHMMYISAPLLADYFHKDSAAKASIISGVAGTSTEFISQSFLPYLQSQTNVAGPYYFAGFALILSAINCYWGLADYIEIDRQSRLSSMIP